MIAAAVALAAAAVFDWTRPPHEQLSVRLFDGAVIGTYRAVLRPVMRHLIVCRYTPTCSAYAQTALHTHGFPKGFWLATKRVVRCTPWTPRGTADPVPPSQAQGQR